MRLGPTYLKHKIKQATMQTCTGWRLTCRKGNGFIKLQP